MSEAEMVSETLGICPQLTGLAAWEDLVKGWGFDGLCKVQERIESGSTWRLANEKLRGDGAQSVPVAQRIRKVALFSQGH